MDSLYNKGIVEWSVKWRGHGWRTASGRSDIGIYAI